MTAFPITSDLQESLTIVSSTCTYQVDFPAVSSLESWNPQADVLIVDDFFAGRLAPELADVAILVRADEEAKSFARMGDLLLQLKRRGINRSSTVLGLGGGVIQDITTFLASVYMRGIAWTYVPSTFLAMADSCLGGKSSINVGPFKNLAGNFHPERLTFYTQWAPRKFTRKSSGARKNCGHAGAAIRYKTGKLPGGQSPPKGYRFTRNGAHRNAPAEATKPAKSQNEPAPN